MIKNKKLIQFDWAIKSILRRKKNFKILEGFLSELLEKDIKIKSILESESNIQNPDDKQNRVDLLVKTNEGEHVIIEIQVQSQSDYLSRVLFATSKEVVENIGRGDKYSVIPKIISISILYFDIFKNDDSVHVMTKAVVDSSGTFYKLSEILKKQQGVADESIDIFPDHYFIEVQKFKGEIRKSLDEWIYFLKTEEIKGDISAKGLKEASSELDYLKLSAKDKRDYNAHLESKSLHAQYIDKVKAESLAQGIAQGIAQGTAQGIAQGTAQGIAQGVAKQKAEAEKEKAERDKKEAEKNKRITTGLLDYGFDLDAISDLTGIDLSELEKLEEIEV
jgi:predicted transposase/invertase (TIGR01784 family)